MFSRTERGLCSYVHIKLLTLARLSKHLFTRTKAALDKKLALITNALFFYADFEYVTFIEIGGRSLRPLLDSEVSLLFESRTRTNINTCVILFFITC